MSSNDDQGNTPEGQSRNGEEGTTQPSRGRHGEQDYRTFPRDSSRGPSEGSPGASETPRTFGPRSSETPRTFDSGSSQGPERVSPPVAPPARGYSQQAGPHQGQGQQQNPRSQDTGSHQNMGQHGQGQHPGGPTYPQPPVHNPAGQGQGPNPYDRPGSSHPGAHPGSHQDASQHSGPQHGGPQHAEPRHAGPQHAGPVQPGSPGSGPPGSDSGAAHASGGGFGQYPPEQPPRREKRGPGWVATIAIAAIAALLGGAAAFGGSYALTSMQDQPNRQVAEQTIETPDWTAVAKKTSQSVVSIQAASEGQVVALGSGSVYDDQGHVVTNNHVVAPADTPSGEINVTMKNGASIRAEIVGRDPSTDIAIIKLEQMPDGVTPLPVGDSHALQVGDPVMALGNPLGLADTVTTGIVSALDRPVSTENIGENASAQEKEMTITNAIQTDAAINPGNSGGPLVDGNGKFIGVNSAAASLSQPGEGGQSGSIGIGFAIPAAQAVMIADQLIATGEAKHPFFGVTIADGQVKQGGITRGSAEVQSVQNGSPAAAAGLQQGDHIIAVDGTPVNNAIALRALVRAQPVQEPIDFTIIRGGQELTLSATLVLQ